MRRRMYVRVVVVLCLSLLLSCYGVNQLQAEDKAIICFQTNWGGNLGNSRAAERLKEAKCSFVYMGIPFWMYICQQDIDYTKKAESEYFLKNHWRLNSLYSNQTQTIARITNVRGSTGVSASMGMKNLTYDQFRELWLENYAKPLIQSCYEQGIYIIDVTQEFGWFDNSWMGPRFCFRDDDTYHCFTDPDAVIYDPNLTVGEFKPKYHETMRALYEWKNANFPKIIFASSLHAVSTWEDTTKLMMYAKDCVDWVGEDVVGYINNDWTYSRTDRGCWEKHYLYNWVPIIEDPNTTAWGTGVFESFGWQNGPEDYYGPPGTPYEDINCSVHSYSSFQGAMDRVVEYDGENKYLKFLTNQGRWVAEFKVFYGMNNPWAILSYANDLGTLPPWNVEELPYPHNIKLRAVYNRWGDTMPHPSDDPIYSSFAYIRDVMHADTNPYWDNSPSTPLVVNREDIRVIPDEDKIYIRVRNLCAPNAISSNIHVYQAPQGTTPWDRSTYIKATPLNVKNSLQPAYEIAFIPAGSFSVPGNGNLDTENNVVELEVSSSVLLDNGKDIHVYIEDSDTVKGWTAYNDIPECSNFSIDGDGYYEFDFYTPGISIGNIYLRARAKDIFGACSKYTDALEVEKQYKLKLTCNAFDNDGINEIEYQYSDDDITWYDVPRQKYYCLTANDKEFKQNSRFTPGSTDMGHYPVIESIDVSTEIGVVPLLVNFNVVASDPVGTITSIEWDFDRDGTIDRTGADVDWTFTQVGVYICLVKVTNDQTFSATETVKVEVLDGSPSAEISAYPESGNAPLTVQFEGTGTDYDGTIVSYEWDFTSDGSIDSTQQNPSFIYNQSGDYTASLTVTDNSGLTGGATLDIKVVAAGEIALCTIIASTKEGDVPLTVNFSVDISGGTVSSYAWDFDNNGVIDSTEAAPSYEYTSSRLYTANLTVTDIGGHKVTDYEYIVVNAVGLPVADFTFSPDGGVAPLEVSFQPTASDPGGTIVSYLWDFGDCTYSSLEVPPPHVYTLNNNYLVRLTVTDNDGNEVTVRKTVSFQSGSGKLYGDGNEYKDIAVNQDMLTGGYYTYSVDPDKFGEECGKTGASIYFRGPDGNNGGSGLANAHGDLTDGNFGYAIDEGVMWSGSTDPEITFDLQGKYALNNIEIWQDPAYDFESVTCYLSQDGISWGEIGIFNSDGLKRVHIDLRNHSARKIKLGFANTAGSSYAYLAEIQIWGTPLEESLMDWVDDFEYSGSPEDYGWQILDGSGILSTEYDDFLKSNVMRVNSSAGYYFGIKRIPTDDPEANYADLEKRYLSYTIKSGGEAWVYVLVSGDDNQWYYLVYRPSDPAGFSHIGGMYVYYNLSTAYDSNQNWNTISRDLEKDLFTATGHHLKNVDMVLIRGGNYCLDELTFSSSAPPTLGWNLVKDGFHTANGSMLKVMDYELGCEAIKVHSDDGNLFGIRYAIEDGIDKKWVHFNYLKAATYFGVNFRILVKGTDDIFYYLAYISGTGGMYIGDANGRTAYHYLGEDNGKWIDVYRDLDRDLYTAFGVYVQEVVNVLSQGGRHYLNLVEFSEEPFNEIQMPLNYGWSISQGVGTVESVHDTDLQSQVMRVNSDDKWYFQIIGPQLNAGYPNIDARYLSFMIKMPERASGGTTWIYVYVYGEDNLPYCLIYRPYDGECAVSSDGKTIYHNIGSDLENNKWHYIMRDLDRDLMGGVGVEVKKVRYFAMRGGGYSLDNLTIYRDKPSEVSASLAAGDWYSQQSPYSGDGEFTNYYNSELGTQVLQIISASGENWNCLSCYPREGYLDITKKHAKFNLKSNLCAGVKFCIQGLDEQYYYITYITGDGVDSISGSGTSAQIFLGAEFSSDGNWHGVSVNLKKDFYEMFGLHLKKTVKVQIHGGNVEIANFRFMDKVELVTGVNLVGYWQFDEGEGITAEDSSGRGNDGMIEGAQWVDGKAGKALSFDGIDDYVDCGDDESLKLSKITIEAWVYSPTSDFAGIHEIAGAEGAYGLTIWDNKLRAHLNTSEGWHWCPVSDALSWVGWHHVALTYDGINTVKYYRDGDLILTDTTTSSGSLQWASWTEDLYIGQVSNGTNLFNGIIDEVRIYNRSLTAQEIAENHGM